MLVLGSSQLLWAVMPGPAWKTLETMTGVEAGSGQRAGKRPWRPALLWCLGLV